MPWRGHGLAAFDAGALATAGALADLQVLDLRGVARPEPDELALGAVVQRLGDELDGGAGVVRLRDDHAEVDGITGQS